MQDAFWYEGMDRWRGFEIAPPGSAPLNGGITAVSRVPISMEIWWVGANGSVRDAFWYEGMDRWGGFELAPQGSAAMPGGITAVSRVPNSMEIWWVGANGSVQDAFWYEGMDRWVGFEIAPQGSASLSGRNCCCIPRPQEHGNVVDWQQWFYSRCVLVRMTVAN